MSHSTYTYTLIFHVLVLVFEGLAMSSGPTPAWSPDTAIVLEGHMTKTKVSIPRAWGLPEGMQVVGQWKTSV